MMTINNTLIGNQMRMQYNYISKCDDQYKQLTNIIQTGTGNCTCPDYSEWVNKIESEIANINKRLMDIEGNISSIKDQIAYILNNGSNDPPPSQNTGTEETVTLSIQTPTSVIDNNAESSPNTVAFDSLLADVEVWETSKMDAFYNDYIAPVIAQNGYNLLAPIPVSALCSCTRIPSADKQNSVLWKELGEENKRAYIMQFILANRSNSTRALYLTNQLIGAFALPL